MAGHVFISYSRTSSPYVTELVSFLHAADIPVWVDSNLDYGDRWGSVIRKQVDTCGAFLPVMTPEAEESPWVTREIIRAESKGRPIIPLLLSGEPFFRLSDMHYEDVRGGRMPTPTLVARLRKLTEKGIAPTPRTTSPQPALQPVAATVLAPSAPTAAARSSTLTITFTRRMNWATGVLIIGSIAFYLSVTTIAEMGDNGDIASTTTVFAAILGLVALIGFAIALRRWRQRQRLTVTAIGLIYSSGLRVVSFYWPEFSSAEIRSGKVVAVATPESPLARRPDMRGRFDTSRGGFVVCDLAEIGATESQVKQAIARFAPSAK